MELTNTDRALRLLATKGADRAALLHVWKHCPGVLEESVSRLIGEAYAMDKANEDAERNRTEREEES